GVDVEGQMPPAQPEYHVGVQSPAHGGPRVDDGSLDIVESRAQILQARLGRHAFGEVEAALQADERQRRHAAFRFADHAAAHHGIGLDRNDLNAERAGELAALARNEPEAVSQPYGDEVELAVDPLVRPIDLLVEHDVPLEQRLCRAAHAHAAQTHQVTLAGQQCDLRLRQKLGIVEPQVVLRVERRTLHGQRRVEAQGRIDLRAEYQHFGAQSILDDAR